LQDFRILILTKHPMLSIAADMGEAFDELAGKLVRAGASVFSATELLPSLEQTARTYTRLFMSFSAAFWPVEAYERVKQIVATTSSSTDARRIQRARAALLSHRDWIAADQLRASLRKGWQDLFRDFDVILCPVMPTTALPHDHLPDQDARRIHVDQNEMNYEDQDPWLTIASMSGLPSTVVPIGQCKSGLPIGMQILGPHLADRTTIAFAGLLEREFGGFCPPPLTGWF
jgi:amidase